MYIEFILDKSELDSPSSYSLGYITITGRQGIISFNKKNILMVYPTLIEILDNVKSLLMKKRDSIEIIGTDSSFSIKMKRLNNNIIEIKSKERIIEKIKEDDLYDCVLFATKKFLSKFTLNSNEDIYDDILCTLLEFEQIKH